MFLALPLDSLDQMSPREELRAIDRNEGPTGQGTSAEGDGRALTQLQVVLISASS